MYTKGSICHFLPVFPLETPFKVTIMFDWFLICLVSSQNFNTPSSKYKKNSSTINHTPNPITTATARQDTYLQRSLFFFNPFHSYSHLSIKAFTILQVIPKSFFFITPILSFETLKPQPSCRSGCGCQNSSISGIYSVYHS